MSSMYSTHHIYQQNQIPLTYGIDLILADIWVQTIHT